LVHLLPTAACCLIGWAVWLVFRPGLIGSDGMWQLHQAWAGTFHDWFPPAMAVALRQVLLLTGSVGTATPIPSVPRCLGVSAAAVLVAGLPFAVEKALVHRYAVARLHPEDQVLAAELVGVCVRRDGLRAELPYTNAHLLEDRFREKYIPGFVNPLYLYSPADS